MSIFDELYPDFKTVMFGDIEMPLSLKPRLRDLPPITEADITAYAGPLPPPRPAVTAWKGADMDAYYLADDGLWKHCKTGSVWVGHAVAEAA